MNNLPHWPTTTIKGSSYLKGRIGWQGLKASEFTDHGPFLITGTDFVGGRIEWSTCYHVTEERFREAEYIHVRNGDLLITKDGTIGKVAYVVDCPPKAVLNSGIFLLRCLDGSYEHRYLYQLLKSHIFDKFLRVYLAGSTINHLYQNVFERFNFPIPNIRVQRRIAEILSTLDEVIAQTEALIAKHQQIKSGVMHDLFTRGVTPDGHLRPTREQAPDLYKESPLGWIPKEWRIKRIRELGVVKGGKRVPAGTPFADAPTPFPYLRVTDMVDGWIDDAALEYVDSTTERLISSYKIFRDDIYVTIAGTLGEFGRIPEHLNGAQLTENAARITEIDQEIVDLDYLCFVLRSDLLEEQKFAGIGVGAGVPKLALYQIERFQVPTPPLEEQRKIQQLLSCSQSNILENREVLKKLRQQKQGLMHDVLTGRVRVPITEQ